MARREREFWEEETFEKAVKAFYDEFNRPSDGLFDHMTAEMDMRKGAQGICAKFRVSIEQFTAELQKHVEAGRETQKLKKSALSKLTPEEKVALGIIDTND